MHHRSRSGNTVFDTRQRTIKFINDEASSVHGSLRAASIFLSESGEWRVGGFDLLSSVKDEEAVIFVSIAMDVW